VATGGTDAVAMTDYAMSHCKRIRQQPTKLRPLKAQNRVLEVAVQRKKLQLPTVIGKMNKIEAKLLQQHAEHGAALRKEIEKAEEELEAVNEELAKQKEQQEEEEAAESPLMRRQLSKLIELTKDELIDQDAQGFEACLVKLQKRLDRDGVTPPAKKHAKKDEYSLGSDNEDLQLGDSE